MCHTAVSDDVHHLPRPRMEYWAERLWQELDYGVHLVKGLSSWVISVIFNYEKNILADYSSFSDITGWICHDSVKYCVSSQTPNTILSVYVCFPCRGRYRAVFIRKYNEIYRLTA